MYLLLTGRKLRLRATIYDGRLCSQTLCSTHCIHRYITTTDNNHSLADIDWSVILLIVGTHKVGTSQKLICRYNAIEVLTLDAHKAWQTSTRTDKHSIEALGIHQRINCNGTTYNNISLELNTQLTQSINLSSNDLLLWQTELWDTIYQHSTQLMQSLEYCHLITHLRQIAGTRQSCRTATDNSHLMSVGISFCYTFSVIFQTPIAHKTLQLTNSHWLALDTQYTRALTLSLLRTNTSANAWQRAILRDDIRSRLEIPRHNVVNKCRDIDIYWTRCYATWIFTIQTTRSLQLSLLAIITIAHLLKVGGTYLSILLTYWNTWYLICHSR